MIGMPPEENQGSRNLARLLSFIVSVSLHAAFIAFAWLLPPFPDDAWSYRESRRLLQIEAAKPRKVIWLQQKHKLPDISPSPLKRAAARQTRPDQPIVQASPPNATHTDQFIYVPRPKPVEQPPIPAPNVVMTQLSETQPQKKFEPPVEQPRQLRPKELVEPALDQQQKALGMGVNPLLGSSMANAPKPAPKKFIPPAEKTRQVEARLVDEPNGLPIQASDLKESKLTVAQGLMDSTPKAPARKFVAPTAISGHGGLGGTPGQGQGAPTLTTPDVAPAAGQPGIPGEISAVILSANPLATNRIPPPDANRAARINTGSAAGSTGQNGAGSASGSGMVVPNLTVRGGKGDDGSAVIARNAAPAAAAPMPATPSVPPTYRPRLDTSSLSVPLRPASRRVPPQVDGNFANRVVYCTVMPGPSNLPDWVVWFGDAEPPPPGSRVVMKPPVPEKTSVPSSVLGAPVEGKLWITARLGKNGRLSVVNIPQGASAQQALDLATEMGKWVFTPAIRNGEAVEVDLLLEASFRLARR
jgi:hypothetical protein